MKGTKGSYEEKGFTMDETMDQVETTDDVIETDAEIIDDTDEGGFAPLLAVGAVATAAGVAIFTQRKRIGAFIEKKRVEHLKKECDKHGIHYVVIEDTDEVEDEEN